ncbi:alpha amylase C-terminal domain-containing protein [Bradyrhizobium sp. BRP22]|uniref:alpha amylase C-terminal domain-containing protein n=1 Tax=Bradyrhizobium sp. BRP22 TaxID=2793821 RepID=UPI001CD74552|nr:alpha amylase C-terminal domain-containing protein [Bradyrhizobium sp. BRP22]
MSNDLRFMRELIAVRGRLRALRRGRINIFHCHNPNRVLALAFRRWLEDLGDDVVVVTSLSETTHFGYRLGLPREGIWYEVFNSDVYDNCVNPIVAGNGGRVLAAGPPLH